jgi:hypothetical protein
MATTRQLNVKLNARQYEGLRRYAARRRSPVAWLIKDYVDALLKSERSLDAGPSGAELTAFAARGGAFDWLREEPDFYSDRDGDPV